MPDNVPYPPEPWPTVVSPTELSNSFLGGLLEICFVTADHQRTMQGLVRLGIGPWRVYTFNSETVTEPPTGALGPIGRSRCALLTWATSRWRSCSPCTAHRSSRSTWTATERDPPRGVRHRTAPVG